MSEETVKYDAKDQEIATTEGKRLPAIDNGKPTIFNPAVMEQVWRASKLFASSDMVPKDYRDKPANCFIAIEMAERMGVNPFAVMQNLSIINGKPGMEAKLIIALINDSGMFVDPLEWEIAGDDPKAADYKVRAYATRAKTGKVCYGPWITWDMVKGEGWFQKAGSKWQTMPSIMFMYRAASFFAKTYAPNITMGMQTREEMEDITVTDVTPHRDAPPLVGTDIVQEKQEVKPGETVVIEGVKDQPEINGSHQIDLAGTSKLAGTAAPARERGKASPGHKRRTNAEIAEDEAAGKADKEAAERALDQSMKQGPNVTPVSETAPPECTHPVEERVIEDGIEYCTVCGNEISGGSAPEIEPLAQAKTAPVTTEGGDIF